MLIEYVCRESREDSQNGAHAGRKNDLADHGYLDRRLRLALAAGCASEAIRPPSPATAMRMEDLLAEPVPPNVRYFVLLFGSQSRPPVPRFVHSWSTVVKATTQPGSTQPELEVNTISWYPTSEVIHPWWFRIQPGTNLELHETIKRVIGHHERVAMWGPYEIAHAFYRRYTTQKTYMESGQVGYQCIDTIGEAAREGDGCDCIHAATDMDPIFDRSRYPLSYFGDAATEHIVEQLFKRPVIINPPQTHDWLIAALKLDCYPIERRCAPGPGVPYSPEAALEYIRTHNGK